MTDFENFKPEPSTAEAERSYFDTVRLLMDAANEFRDAGSLEDDAPDVHIKSFTDLSHDPVASKTDAMLLSSLMGPGLLIDDTVEHDEVTDAVTETTTLNFLVPPGYIGVTRTATYINNRLDVDYTAHFQKGVQLPDNPDDVELE